MYTDFYKLTALPFQLTPDPRFFFGSSVHNKAMAHLAYGLNQGEGFIIITGEVGAGKTTLVGYLLSTLDNARYLAARIVTTIVLVGSFNYTHFRRDQDDGGNVTENLVSVRLRKEF